MTSRSFRDRCWHHARWLGEKCTNPPCFAKTPRCRINNRPLSPDWSPALPSRHPRRRQTYFERESRDWRDGWCSPQRSRPECWWRFVSCPWERNGSVSGHQSIWILFRWALWTDGKGGSDIYSIHMMGFYHEVHLKIFTNCQPKERESEVIMDNTILKWDGLSKNKVAERDYIRDTYRNQSTDQRMTTRSVGTPIAESTSMSVINPALGIAAAPMLAAVAVMLNKLQKGCLFLLIGLF